MQITQIDPDTDKRWDRFLLEHERGLIYHHPAWINVLRSAYKHTPFIVGLEQGKTRQLEGIAPFLLVKSRFTGKRLVSLPFTSYCDPLMPTERMDDVIQFACAHFPDVDYIELRCLEPLQQAPDLSKDQTSYMTHILELRSGLEEILKSFHSTSVRQRIRRAEKNSMKFRLASGEKDLKTFYNLLTSIRKSHGLPPQPFTFFSSMWKCLLSRNMLLLPVVELDGRIIAAATVLKYKKTFYFEYSASDQQFKKLCPNQMLIWEIIKIAIDEGAIHFDFGRSNSENQSLVEFKDRWGTKRYPLA